MHPFSAEAGQTATGDQVRSPFEALEGCKHGQVAMPVELAKLSGTSRGAGGTGRYQSC